MANRPLPALHRPPHLWRDKENVCAYNADQLFPARRNRPAKFYHHRHQSPDEPTTSTKINECPPFRPPNLNGTTFSTSSSISDDEVETRKHSKRLCMVRTVYSTSDITTSDSSIQPYHLASTNSMRNIGHNHTFSDSSDEEDAAPDDDLNDFSPVLNPELQPNVNDESDLPPPCPVNIDSFEAPRQRHHQSRDSDRIYRNVPLRLCSFPKQKLPNEPVSIFSNDFEKSNRPDDFNLPGPLARIYNIQGILFIKVYMHDLRLEVRVEKSAFFLDRYVDVFSQVKVELKRNSSRTYRKRSKKERRYPADDSDVVAGHNPRYRMRTYFDLTESNLKNHDKLGISVFTADQNCDDVVHLGQRLGQMTFSLRKLFLTAQNAGPRGYGNMDRVSVLDGGYFLLGGEQGETTNMPQDKILHNKYYDDVASSTLSTSSSTHSSSPIKMMSDEVWRTPLLKDPRLAGAQAQAADPRRFSLQVTSKLRQSTARHPQYVPAMMQHSDAVSLAIVGLAPRKKVSLPVRAISQDQQNMLSQTRKGVKPKKDNMDTMNLSKLTSSSSSFSSTGADYRSHHRHTLPYIMTTAEQSHFAAKAQKSDQQPSCSTTDDIDYKMLYADSAPPQQHQRLVKESKSVDLPRKALTTQPSVSGEPLNPAKTSAHPSVRRVASFTYANESADKTNKRVQPAGNSRKFNFPTISKIGNFIRNKVEKVDMAISTTGAGSALPTLDEIKSWQDSFEALLGNKVGLDMFRRFVIGEISSENLDFYLDVEDYKKCRNKAKLQQKSQAIMETYFNKDAVSELNLDSETKNATLTALEAGPTADTFNLAQGKILQLMAKDSYRRFLQSRLYLDLVHASSPPSSARTAHSASPRATPSPLEDSSGKASPVAGLPPRRHTGHSQRE